jgi:phospholipase C
MLNKRVIVFVHPRKRLLLHCKGYPPTWKGRAMQKQLAKSLVALVFAGSMTAVARAQSATTTPIEHLVVIFQENVSFDHYFGTYPNALNPSKEPRFVAASGTPSVDGLTEALLHNNPNKLNSENGSGRSNPFRLDRSQVETADQDHDYLAEQRAFHGGLMDLFPKYTGKPGPPPSGHDTHGLVMGYFDGNTVTAFWNYAQRFAMSDNSHGTNFGSSSVGAINLVSGQTNGVVDRIDASSDLVPDGGGGYTVIASPDPVGDVCSTSSVAQVKMGGENVGDLLNRRGITWGFFAGGFDLKTKNPDGSSGCRRSHKSEITGKGDIDYQPHHEPFQFYASTENPKHTRPSSNSSIGMAGDPANHQYDMQDFYNALNDGNFPAVSFLKAPSFQDGHAGYSNPLDEQTFVVTVINFLQHQKEWGSTAVIIAYDDSDGWYDHQMGPIVNQSATEKDALTGPGECGKADNTLPGVSVPHAQGRCGYGPRLPLLVISPYARQNYVDHSLTDQSSILRFIEDNWLDGQRIQGSFDAIAGSLNGMFDFDKAGNDTPYLLDPSTGEVVTK